MTTRISKLYTTQKTEKQSHCGQEIKAEINSNLKGERQKIDLETP